jgi:hypothetical protein
MATHHNSLQEPIAPAARPQIKALLDDILQSVPFRTSQQCRNLFRYVVEHSLAGADESLRERLIGIEVFGRSPDYDTAEDPVVRLRAADIRKRLAQYYQTHKDAPGNWKIEIPTGSYRAQFYPLPPARAPVPIHSEAESAVHAELPKAAHVDSVSSPAQPKKSTQVRILLVTTASLVAVIAALLLTRTISRASTASDLFWEPVLDNPKPTLVCTGSNPVYLLSQEALVKYKTTHLRDQDSAPNFQTLVPREELKNFGSADFRPIKDTYLTVGDASVISQISSLLTTHRHPLDLRFGSDLSFGDLRQGSAVLIGAFNNSWTLNMTDHLRFVFDGSDSPEVRVQDRVDKSRSWHPKLSQGKVVEDYAIVSRVVDTKTGSVFITIAGLYHPGTQAAGDFATNPRLIAEFAKQAPKDWSKKNLQLVLHTNVVNDVPDSPTVVAAHYW